MSLRAYEYLHKNIEDLSTYMMLYVKFTYPVRTRDHFKCKRDIKYILWAISRCCLHENPEYIKEISKKFIKNKSIVLVDHRVELETYDWIEKEIIKFLGPCEEDIVITKAAFNILRENFITLEEPMYGKEFRDLIQERKTTFAFSNVEVPRNTVEDILLDLHMYVPSKQNSMPYYIDVLDWSNPELRNNIFEWCWRDPKHDVHTDKGNPQVLAPYLFVFTPKPTDKSSNDYAEAMIEIGIASSFIVWNAQSRGLSTGYCACVQDALKISEALGRPKKEVSVLLGMGYKDENATKYIDPRINAEKEFPKDHSYHKSNQENIGNYIIWH